MVFGRATLRTYTHTNSVFFRSVILTMVLPCADVVCGVLVPAEGLVFYITPFCRTAPHLPPPTPHPQGSGFPGADMALLDPFCLLRHFHACCGPSLGRHCGAAQFLWPRLTCAHTHMCASARRTLPQPHPVPFTAL